MATTLVTPVNQKSWNITHKTNLDDPSELGHFAVFGVVDVKPERIFNIPIHSAMIKGMHNCTHIPINEKKDERVSHCRLNNHIEERLRSSSNVNKLCFLFGTYSASP